MRFLVFISIVLMSITTIAHGQDVVFENPADEVAVDTELRKSDLTAAEAKHCHRNIKQISIEMAKDFSVLGDTAARWSAERARAAKLKRLFAFDCAIGQKYDDK